VVPKFKIILHQASSLRLREQAIEFSLPGMPLFYEFIACPARRALKNEKADQ